MPSSFYIPWRSGAALSKPSPTTGSAALFCTSITIRGGRDTTAFFQQELGNRNIVDRSSTYHGFKDLNEWWVSLGSKDATRV